MFTNRIFLLLLWVLFQCGMGHAEEQNPLLSKTYYSLPYEPIDVVIPCADKDIEVLELCIEGIKKNGKNVRRVIVVSPRRLTERAEWFDEKNYPFTKLDLATEIFGDRQKAEAFISEFSRIGWIYQQFLKLYAPFVIPNISSNVLVLDADTIFLNPVEFLGPFGEGLYNPGAEYAPPYFEHAQKLLPGFRRVYPEHSGISHHMLFQRNVMGDLFSFIEAYHKIEPWKALCRCIDLAHVAYSSLSEYEIYFNFVFMRSDQMRIRPLKWANIQRLRHLPYYRRMGYHYVSCHAYDRKN